jgi:periplasmic protein CpxP/Spy
MKLPVEPANIVNGSAGSVSAKPQSTQWRSFMRNTRKILVGAFAAAALAASSALIYAQPAAQGTGWRDCPAVTGGHGAGRGGHGMMHHGPGAARGGMWSNPTAAVEGHLAALKVELKITSDQDSAWKTFTDKARQQAGTMIARRAQMIAQAPATPKPAPDSLAQRTEFAKQRLAGMETMTAAVKDLYAVLTPEQKTLADQLLARGSMGGGGRGMGGGRGFRG